MRHVRRRRDDRERGRVNQKKCTGTGQLKFTTRLASWMGEDMYAS